MTYPVIQNPVTKERGIVRRTPSDEHPGLIADLYAAPGAAVVGEHTHPHSTESFTVVRGELRMTLDGEERAVEPGRRVVIPPGTPHDWWNAGTETAYVILEVDPGARFEAMIRNLFGLASDGRTDDTGRPSLLQSALLGREFDDVIRFTSPPRAIQRPLFAALTPLARRTGLRGCYPHYLGDTGETVDEIEALPPEVAALVPGL
ncbi:cupin domain-containing protein [Nocardioides sp. S-58]|uniref:Cupin domain-containing protein n=1 Tax=Nocardioides renjunii TaxID=3095075 RepID=A0ABU5KFD1_9ACTN|nr:cupin domain-containing protein [Nocardioides sp. S-58]MDZ5663673.1 cupin domain-containing protein [Nocardioides sp. S-58]